MITVAGVRHWREIDPSADIEPIPLPFSQSVGPQLPSMTNHTPADYFHLLFTNEVLDLVIEETNRYIHTIHLV